MAVIERIRLFHHQILPDQLSNVTTPVHNLQKTKNYGASPTVTGSRDTGKIFDKFVLACAPGTFAHNQVKKVISIVNPHQGPNSDQPLF
jgi:hypothetical protein